MKKNILLLALALFLCCATSSARNLTVRIVGFYPSAGKVNISLFDREGFLKKSLETRQESSDKDEIVVTFENIPDGQYAVSAIQDANANGQLDYSMMGVPTEPFGLSGIKGAIMGAPSFKEVAFEVKEDTQITIYLIDMSLMF